MCRTNNIPINKNKQISFLIVLGLLISLMYTVYENFNPLDTLQSVPSNNWNSPRSADAFADAVEASSLEFTTGGDQNWNIVYDEYHNGDSSVKSEPITHGEESYFQTMVSGYGNIEFYWKVSSESSCDMLNFYIDGVLKTSISGSVDWAAENYYVSSSGIHTLKWIYTKDYSVNTGDDCGWIDSISWSGSLYAPEVTITSPASSDLWFKGEQETIRWELDSSVDTVDISLYYYSSGYYYSVSSIVSSTANDGVYRWTIPSGTIIRDDYVILIASSDNPGEIYEFSSQFEIDFKPTITVLSPRYNDKYNPGDIVFVSWEMSRSLPSDHRDFTIILKSSSGDIIDTGSFTGSPYSDGISFSTNFYIPEWIDVGKEYYFTIQSDDYDDLEHNTNTFPVSNSFDTIFWVIGISLVAVVGAVVFVKKKNSTFFTGFQDSENRYLTATDQKRRRFSLLPRARIVETANSSHFPMSSQPSNYEFHFSSGNPRNGAPVRPVTPHAISYAIYQGQNQKQHGSISQSGTNIRPINAMNVSFGQLQTKQTGLQPPMNNGRPVRAFSIDSSHLK